jgi:hypothetical protein
MAIQRSDSNYPPRPPQARNHSCTCSRLPQGVPQAPAKGLGYGSVDRWRRVLALVLGVVFIPFGIAETFGPSAVVMADSRFGTDRSASAVH